MVTDTLTASSVTSGCNITADGWMSYDHLVARIRSACMTARSGARTLTPSTMKIGSATGAGLIMGTLQRRLT
jgi:hypothetical protein